jgi:hypothetical protein
MLSKTVRTAKKAALVSAAAGLATAASLALIPGSPALAATSSCRNFTSGGVSFSVCAKMISTTRVMAEVKNIRGTYVSGGLKLWKGSSIVASGCNSRYSAGSSCAIYWNGTTGTHMGTWVSSGSGSFSSGLVYY